MHSRDLEFVHDALLALVGAVESVLDGPASHMSVHDDLGTALEAIGMLSASIDAQKVKPFPNPLPSNTDAKSDSEGAL